MLNQNKGGHGFKNATEADARPSGKPKHRKVMKKVNLILTTVFALGFLGACDDDDGGSNGDPQPADSLELPQSYKWQDVQYPEQTATIELLAKLSGAVGEADQGESVDESNLKNIFTNQGSVVDADVSIADQIPQSDRSMFEGYFEKMDNLTNDPNANDTVIDGRYYFPNGVEPQQFIEKGLMGACLYYQATAKKLANLPAQANENPQEGDQPTPREKQFDEAFGYLAVPKNLPNNDKDEVAGDFVNSTWFWGHYLRTRNSELKNKEKLFNAFLKGRKAITQQLPTKREEAVETIYREWEKLVASNVAHYVNSTLSDMENNAMGDKWHHWSEAVAFTMCLKYSPQKTISSGDINSILEKLGDSPKNITKDELENINQTLDGIYDFPSPITAF